ncbi:hypothetical protein J6590_018971 [Homalodisca vitripennis]|nr:hypothetical protein J6590_018971 [Homalodisca vitripennis]
MLFTGAMSAPGGGKKDSGAFKTSGLRRSPPGSAPTTQLLAENESAADTLEKRVRRGDRLEEMVKEALGVIEMNAAKMSKANNVATLRDTILEPKIEIVKQRADVAYLRGRVDERSFIQRETLKYPVGEAISERTPSWPEVAKSSPSAVVTVRGWAKDIPKAVNPTIFIKPAEGKRAVEDIHKDLFASFNTIAEGLKICNLWAIEVGDWETVSKIKKSRALADKGLSVSDSTKVAPCLIVYDVDSSLSNEEFVSAVFDQNEFVGANSLELFKKAFNL